MSQQFLVQHQQLAWFVPQQLKRFVNLQSRWGLMLIGGSRILEKNIFALRPRAILKKNHKLGTVETLRHGASQSFKDKNIKFSGFNL